MATVLTVSATDFKAKCLDIFDQLESGRLTEVVVTKRGRPVTRCLPPSRPERRGLWGFAAGTVHCSDPDYDFTGPILDVVPNAARDVSLEEFLSGSYEVVEPAE